MPPNSVFRITIKNLIFRILSFLILSVSAHASANELNIEAVEFVKQKSHEVIAEINFDRNVLKKNSDDARQLIEESMNPYVDVTYLSHAILGEHWRRANHDNRLTFALEFRTYLSRFASLLLSDFLTVHTKELDYCILKFKKGLSLDKENKIVNVYATFKPKTKDAESIIFSVRKGTYGWKINDVTVGGVSAKLSVKNQIRKEADHKGITSLAKILKNRNQEMLVSKLSP